MDDANLIFMKTHSRKSHREMYREILSLDESLPVVAERLNSLCGAFYFVGGVVRDILLDRLSPKDDGRYDIDIAIPGIEYGVLVEAFSDFKVIPLGEKFNTLMLLTPKSRIEITQFRGADLEEDLRLRDFTINSIALGRDGLIDPLAGQEDLQNKQVRGGNFADDPLRLLRLVRFAVLLDFDVELKTFDQARRCAALLNNVSAERIRDEFCQIMLSDRVTSGLSMLKRLGLFESIIPEMLECYNFAQNRYHKEDVFEHIISVVDRCVTIDADLSNEDKLILRLAALFHDIGKPRSLSVDEAGERHFYDHEYVSKEIAESRLASLRLPAREIKSIAKLVGLHMRPLQVKAAGLRRILRDVEELFPLWLLLKRADKTPIFSEEDYLREESEFLELLQTIKEKEALTNRKILVINGDVLVEAGLRPSPRLGNIIKILEEEVIENPELNDKSYLIERARLLWAEFNMDKSKGD